MTVPVFSHPEFDDHEEVAFGYDRESGLKAIVAIHNRARGPALGGCRMWPYQSEEEALTDVLRLSRGMTYKAAMAGLELGGGKSVVIADPQRDKSPALFRAMGRFVEGFGGRYIVAEDVGIAVEDVELMAAGTRHVAGAGNGGAGDPSPATAYGVFMGLRAAIAKRLGRTSVAGLRVAVQGLGHVGRELAGLLSEQGAELIVSDIHDRAVEAAVRQLGARAVAPEAIYDAEADVFAPCALGAILNDDTIPRLKAQVVAGSANNQLAEDRHGDALKDRGILYAPDYVINAGGLIYVSGDAHRTNGTGRNGAGFDHDAALARVAGIQDTLMEIFERAEDDGLATSAAADRIA
ncbi:MAG: Glu/Leu/Phe/Val dehydrogenase dimerization domain-containing protein, partial [Kiloniellales bacterium]|nr:Glu/Leu/Phe/Val dehydrogenase dimerization domain-containing protein [Kiloniellales bacterium]